MMKKHIRLLLLFVLFGLGNSLFAQRGGTNPTVTFVPTITHGTCFDPEGSVEFEVVVSSEWDNDANLNRLDVYDENPSLVYTTTNPSLTGSIGALPAGVYTVSGSVSALNSNGMWVGIPFSATFWVGIQAVWVEKIDMVALPNSYSAKRNASTATYGGVRSSNGTDSGDGWIEMKAQYGSTTDNRVFWLIGETTPLGTFSSGGSQQYIEFFEGSGGNGIQLRYETSTAGTYTTTTLSTNQDDKVRLVRNGATLTIQLNDDPTTVFTFPQTYSGPMNIAVRSLAQDDGCLDVISSFTCNNDAYVKVERKLKGVKYQVPGDFLKFYVTEEYDNQSTDLDYNVYSSSDRVNPVISGSQQVHSVEFGDNRYKLDVESLSAGTYILEVINEKKEKFYLRFVKS